MGKRYTVSKDIKSGLWYAHMKGFAYIPVFGSFCKKKSDAMEYAKCAMGFRIEWVKLRKGKNRSWKNITVRRWGNAKLIRTDK